MILETSKLGFSKRASLHSEHGGIRFDVSASVQRFGWLSRTRYTVAVEGAGASGRSSGPLADVCLNTLDLLGKVSSDNFNLKKHAAFQLLRISIAIGATDVIVE